MISIVLVRTGIEENIGFVSRVIENMGADQLILVEPKCEITIRAIATAASGIKPLENRITFQSWTEFSNKEKAGTRFAFTSRKGQFRPAIDFEHSIKKLVDTNFHGFPIYLIFGPENNGLTNEELIDCQNICSLPIFGSNPSMNLSHAVMLALFVLQNSKHKGTISKQPTTNTLTDFPTESLRTWLLTLGYDLSGQTNAYNVLRQLFQTSNPTPKQLLILEKVLQQSIRLIGKNHSRVLPSETDCPNMP